MAYKGATKTSTSYRIKFDDKKDLLIVLRKDNESCLRGDEKPLWAILANIAGVYDVDYDGHFGNCIYLTVGADHDEYSTWKKLKKCINDYLEGG